MRAAHDSSTMFNSFDIEIEDKTYYATAPLEWVKEQARVGLSDRGWNLANARHDFLHSSLENNQWETAFHQLKAAADEYKKWRNQVCAFFNFRQPEITLQQGEWTQVAQFVGYYQEWEQLDNARLLIAEFTPQQAFEFLGVYQQYQRYVSLVENNAQQGVDTTHIDKQIAALEQSLNEKVAQNLPLIENRQVMFDLFGTQLGLFDEETQPESEKQGVSASEKTTERLPENTVQGTTTPENSDRLPENAWKAVPKEKIKEERKDEYFTTPKVLERSNYWIVDNGVVVTLDQYRPMYNRHMTIKTFDTVEEAKQYAERFFELEQGISASENSQPANLSLWLEENGFDFESVDSHSEVFQKDNLKLAVYNEDGDYFVSLSQFDKNIPIAEIDEKMIEPTRQERIYFFQNTDDLEKLSQYLRAMEQGVSVSATPENGVETQPETVSDSPNSKFLGKEFTIDGDTFASATLIQIKSRKINNQFTDLGYKTELEIHAIHGNHFARSISEQDFQRLAGKKGYGLFYDTSKREFVAVGGKMGERGLFEMPASQFGKEFETLLTELRNTYNIDGSKIVNSQTESLSGSLETEKQGVSASEKTAERLPETQEQGTTASEIPANEVKQDLSGQPEKSIEKIVDDYIRATAHNSTLENYQQIMRNYFLQKIDGNNPFFENRPDKMVRAEWLLSLAQNPKNFITIKNREMPELKVVIIDNQKVDIAPDEIRFFNYVREQQRIGLAEKTPVADKSIKELKAELKAAKDALTAAKKELKGLRDEFDSKRGYSYFNTSVAEVQIIHKQQEVLNWQNQFDNLTLQLKTQTGEITDLEREILTARLSGNINARVDIVRRELKTQKDELRQQYDEMGERIKKGEVYEFEIQSVMQEAVDYYSGIRGIGTIYHNNKPLPLNTDREKAIAYLLKQELPRQQFEQFGKPHNRIIRQLNNRLRVRWDINFTTRLVSLQTKYLDAIESAENQLMKGSIETATEINLTYDINTPDGEQKVRELFYGSRHDENQAELFERVFAMAQKLGVEVRHALRDSGENKEINKFVLGQYSLAKNSARVKHNGYIKPEQKGEVLLHELVHSVTSRAMLLKEQGHTELLNDAQIKAIDEIERIYQAVVAKAEELGFEKYQEKGGVGIGGDYGLKNSHEFIAELSNPKFREKLKQVAVFDDTVKAMTEVATGVEKTETAYDRLTAALYQIIDNYDIDFGAKYEQAKYGNIKMHDIFSQPDEQENTMKISNLYKDKDGFAVNMREFNDGDYDYSVFYRDTFLKSFRSPEYAIQAIHQNKTALLEQYHRMTYRPSHTENGVTYFTGGFTYLNADRLPEKENQMEQTTQAAESGVFLPESSVKHDMNGLPENYQVRAADFDDFNPNLDGKTITANTLYSDIYTDIKPEQQGKTVGEVLRSDENALWDAEFWGELVGHGTVKVSDDLVAQVIETQRSEVLEEILSCGNVPFTKEHIEALYEREPELIQEVANDYNEPEIKALAKEVVQTAEIGLKKQAFNNMFALLQVSDKISALEKRLQKQPNASAVQTELTELKHEQVKLEEEYDKITNRAFDAGISLEKIRNGAKRQHAEFSGKPITSMQQLVDKLDKAYPINKGEPFVKLDFFDDSKENERSNATLSITATELFFREVDKYDKRHTIDDYAFFNVKIVDNDGKELKNGDYDIVKTEDIIENHSGLFGFLLNKNSFSPNPQQEKADENLALVLSDYLDDKVKNELPAYLEKIADYKALPSATGTVSLPNQKQAQVIRDFNQRLQEHLQNKEVKHDLNNQPETTKTLTLSEQALEDGKRLNQADEKVKNAEWECAKKPNDKERNDNLKAALAERAALHDEIKPRVQAAMDSGKPYITEYTEDGKPFELVVTQSNTLRLALGSYESEPKHNHLLCTINGEVALNAEQRSTPERVAEVLKENFNDKHSDISEKLALINYPAAEKVFSEKEIKDTLNKALKSSFQAHQTAAIKSPVMRAEWLEHIATSTKVPEPIRQAAKNEMAERFGTAEVKQDALGQPETAKKQTADKGGVSLGATQQNALQQAVVAQKVMQSQTTVKSHRMRH